MRTDGIGVKIDLIAELLAHMPLGQKPISMRQC